MAAELFMLVYAKDAKNFSYYAVYKAQKNQRFLAIIH
ncbi:hypothetical protein J2Y40_004195 [Chryseobacterium sp. 2987]|nr:hypothetical protein [Chryseobacterium sp. 2987]